MKKYLLFLALGLTVFLLAGCTVSKNDNPPSASTIHNLKASELKTMLTKKDFFLLDVHIPEQKHIAGTDAFINYRKLKENINKLPKDKTKKIVVYCRSGSMSKKASDDLIKLGYTNVYDLEGGINAFNAMTKSQ